MDRNTEYIDDNASICRIWEEDHDLKSRAQESFELALREIKNEIPNEFMLLYSELLVQPLSL